MPPGAARFSASRRAFFDKGGVAEPGGPVLSCVAEHERDEVPSEDEAVEGAEDDEDEAAPKPQVPPPCMPAKPCTCSKLLCRSSC